MSSLSSCRRHRFTTDWPGRRLERRLERRPSAAMCMGVAAKVAATPRRADAIHLGRLVSRALQRGAAITTSRSWLSRNRTMFMFYPQSLWVIEVVCSLCSCPKCFYTKNLLHYGLGSQLTDLRSP